MRREPHDAASVTPHAGSSSGGAHHVLDPDVGPIGPQVHRATDRATGGLKPHPGGLQSGGLDDQLCFALYAATNAVVRAYRPLLRAVGLTYPEYVVLMALWEADGTSVTDLSVRAKISLDDLAPIVDRLIDADLVEGHRTRLDRRTVRLSLTDRGRLMEERAAVAQHEVRCQTKLSDAELEQLRGSLHDLTHTLEDESADPRPDVDVAAS